MLRIIAITILLTGCVTPYQPSGARGGYRDMQLDTEVYQVDFYGNGYTHIATIRNYWLRRCAELSQSKGYPYFKVVSGDAHTDSSLQSTMGNNIQTVHRHSVSGTIQLLNFKPEGDAASVYNADVILRNYAH